MSCDKYSDDHTIKVSKGTGLLCIDGNLKITGDFNLEGNAIFSGNVDDLTVNNSLVVGDNVSIGQDLIISGEAGIGGSLTVGESINVNGEISSSNLIFNTPLKTLSYIPINHLFMSSEIQNLNLSGGDAPTFTDPYGLVPTLTVGTSAASEWRFEAPLNPHLINGGRLRGLWFLIEVASSNGFSTYPIDISIISTPSLGNSITRAVNDSSFITVSSAAPPSRFWYRASLDVDLDIDSLGGSLYSLRLAQSIDTNQLSIRIYACKAEIEIDNLSTGLNKFA